MPKNPGTGFADPREFGTAHAPLPDGWTSMTPLVSVPASEAHLPLSVPPLVLSQQQALQGQLSRVLAQDTSGARNFTTRAFGNVKIVAASDATPEEKATADYVCDGFADEAEIANALLEGSVRLSSGTFNFNASLEMRSDTALVGQGPETNITFVTGTSATILINVADGISNWRIANLGLTGIDNTGATVNIGINVEDASEFEISSVISTNLSRAIRLNGAATDFIISDCQSDADRFAVFATLTTVTRGTIKGGLVLNSTAGGIVLSGFDVSILACNIYNVAGVGILLDETTSCLVANCIIRSCTSDAIQIDATGQATIIGVVLPLWLIAAVGGSWLD